MSPSQFDKALRNYISSNRYKYYPIPNPPGIASNNYTVVPLSGSAGNAVLADIHLHSRDYQERALTEFQDILKSDPSSATACRGLGYAYLQKRDFSQAADYFKRASQLDSRDPRVHYYSALLAAREGGFGGDTDLPAMTRELEISISLDPNFADSYALLAFAQSTGGDPATALVTMRKAIAISPRNEHYFFNLANLYLANRQPDKAIAILQALRVTDDPPLESQVAATLAQAQQFRKMVQTGAADAGSRMIVVQKEDAAGHAAPQNSNTAPPVAPAKVQAARSAQFVRGTLTHVACTTDPSVVLTVVSGSQTLELKVADKGHLILIGTDKFSCSWTKQKVAVNYRENERGELSVISLEIQ